MISVRVHCTEDVLDCQRGTAGGQDFLRGRISNVMLGLKVWPWEGKNALFLTERWYHDQRTCISP